MSGGTEDPWVRSCPLGRGRWVTSLMEQQTSVSPGGDTILNWTVTWVYPRPTSPKVHTHVQRTGRIRLKTGRFHWDLSHRMKQKARSSCWAWRVENLGSPTPKLTLMTLLHQVSGLSPFCWEDNDHQLLHVPFDDSALRMPVSAFWLLQGRTKWYWFLDMAFTPASKVIHHCVQTACLLKATLWEDANKRIYICRCSIRAAMQEHLLSLDFCPHPHLLLQPSSSVVDWVHLG